MMRWALRGLGAGLLAWLLPELATCQDGDDAVDPEELSGGETHLGALGAPQLDMLSLEEMRRLHKVLDLDGNGAFSLQELLEYSRKLDAVDSLDKLQLTQELEDFKDGKLSLEEILRTEHLNIDGFEADARLRKLLFSHADKDRDGHLDEAELAVFYSAGARYSVLAEASHTEKDKDRSGQLSKIEFFSEPGSAFIIKDEGELMDEDHATFRELDRDGSGDIDKHELQEWESGRFHTKAELAPMIASADGNRDGEVTLDEFLGAHGDINGTSAMFHLLEWHARQDL